MIKLLCPDPESFSQKGLDYAEKISDLTAAQLTQDEFNNLASSYDAVLIRFNTKVSSRILNKKSKLKTIISPTTGLDHIDMNSANKNGVRVIHLYGEKKFLKTISGTAELTVGLMISILRKIPQSFDSVKEGSWNAGIFRGNELNGKTIGIIGCGRLGSKVSKAANALGMNVISYDPYISRFPSGVKPITSQAELLNKADIISLHVPLIPETNHLIGHKEFSLMKNGVVIINTSRGAVIDSQSLIKNLKSGKVSSAAVDVIENEHSFLGDNHPLVNYASKYNNLIITPHIGGATFESVQNTDLFILKKFKKQVIDIHV